MKLLSIVGARPQFIKLSSISRVILPSIQHIILHTGQHYDTNLSSIFFTELNIPQPDYNLNIGSDTHAIQTGNMLIGIEEILIKEQPDWVLVYGDTNSTLAGSLASVKLHIPTAHIEAGVRSFNKIMPEEINRLATDHISDLLFAPTLTAMRNLSNEGLKDRSEFVGDVMHDNVLHYGKQVLHNPQKYRIKNLPEYYLLLTIHRAENTNSSNIAIILESLSKINAPIIFPIHPRTRKFITSVPSNITLIDPVGYLEMISLILNSRKVITDSGGIQKEAYFLRKRCITLRNETEWPETLGGNWNILTGIDNDKIIQAIYSPLITTEQGDDFGNGHAAEKIISYLLTKNSN
jgi:UDP-GlcNAc3NAcA epimerase